jgi:zinc-ribbon domain
MICQACGAPLAEEVRFCPKCGAQMVAASPVYATYRPPMAIQGPAPRVQRNLQMLGILWCAFGVYRIVGGLVGMFFLRAFTMRPFGSGWPFGPAFMGSLLPFVAAYTVFVAALALLVRYSLLTRRPWGRTLAIIVGILTLLKPLLGTALGIYTLWVLAPSASGAEYEAIADRT